VIASMKHLGLAVLLALSTAGCNASGNQIAPGVTAVSADSTPGPGEVKIGVRNPNPEKWTAAAVQPTRTGTVRHAFTCKVLSCPDPVSAIVSSSVPRGQRPDQKALEKLAKETLPKLTQARNLELQVASDNKAKIDTLSSATLKLNTYSAVLNETKVTVGERSRHNTMAIIIAGRALIIISADANDRAGARAAIEEFSKSFTIEEGPAL
jgi:hypothetical protein